MNFWLGDELSAARTPDFIALLDVDHAKVNKRAQRVEILWWRCNDLRLVVRSTAAAINRYPNVFQTQKHRFAFAQHRGAEHITIKGDRTSYVGNNQRYSYDEFWLRIFVFMFNTSF